MKILNLLIASTLINACGSIDSVPPTANQILLIQSQSVTGRLLASRYTGLVSPKISKIISQYDFSIRTNLPENYQIQLHLNSKPMSLESYNNSLEEISDSAQFEMLVVQRIDDITFDMGYIIVDAKSDRL